jgi:hypothetical protein
VPWTLLMGLGLLTLGAIFTSVSDHPRNAPAPPPAATRLPAPFDDVQWKALRYPGLHCGYFNDESANVGATGRYVRERVADLRVTGRSAPWRR